MVVGRAFQLPHGTPAAKMKRRQARALAVRAEGGKGGLVGVARRPAEWEARKTKAAHIDNFTDNCARDYRELGRCYGAMSLAIRFVPRPRYLTEEIESLDELTDVEFARLTLRTRPSQKQPLSIRAMGAENGGQHGGNIIGLGGRQLEQHV